MTQQGGCEALCLGLVHVVWVEDLASKVLGLDHVPVYDDELVVVLGRSDEVVLQWTRQQGTSPASADEDGALH